MDQIDFVNELLIRSGFEDWRVETGVGGSGYFAVKSNHILWIAPTKFPKGLYVPSITAKVVFEEVESLARPILEKFNCYDSCFPGSVQRRFTSPQLRSGVVSSTDDFAGEFLEALVKIKEDATDFFVKCSSIESAATETSTLNHEDQVECFGFPAPVRGLVVKKLADSKDFDSFVQLARSDAFAPAGVRPPFWDDMIDHTLSVLDRKLVSGSNLGSQDEQATTMASHEVAAKANLCGFFSSKKSTILDLASTEELPKTQCSLDESCIGFRSGIEEKTIDAFELETGSLFVTCTEVLSDLDLSEISKGQTTVAFRVLDSTGTYFLQCYEDGDLIFERVDDSGRTMQTGSRELLTSISEGKMTGDNIFGVVEKLTKVDFWKIPSNSKGIRILVA